jgi:hypothetical protein
VKGKRKVKFEDSGREGGGNGEEEEVWEEEDEEEEKEWLRRGKEGGEMEKYREIKKK